MVRPRHRRGDQALWDRLLELTAERPRYGYRRLHLLLDREVSDPINSKKVYRIFREEGLGHHRPLPERIGVDNGPEFTSEPLDRWAYDRKVELRFIRPNRPIKNCLEESFNGKFRDERLNMQWFPSVNDARIAAEAWCRNYNRVRP